MSDLEGYDAFNTVLDRLIDAAGEAKLWEAERQQLRSALSEANQEVAKLSKLTADPKPLSKTAQAAFDEVILAASSVTSGATAYMEGPTPGMNALVPSSLIIALTKAIEAAKPFSDPLPF